MYALLYLTFYSCEAGCTGALGGAGAAPAPAPEASSSSASAGDSAGASAGGGGLGGIFNDPDVKAELEVCADAA